MTGIGADLASTAGAEAGAETAAIEAGGRGRETGGRGEGAAAAVTAVAVAAAAARTDRAPATTPRDSSPAWTRPGRSSPGWRRRRNKAVARSENKLCLEHHIEKRKPYLRYSSTLASSLRLMPSKDSLMAQSPAKAPRSSMSLFCNWLPS